MGCDFVKVVWLDAADDEVNKSELERSTDHFIVRRVSYGKLVKSDKFGVLLCRGEDVRGECEVTVIPKGCVVKVVIIK